MKRLSHIHLVQVKGSYTDQHCFAFLMLPVAECNLFTFLSRPTLEQMPTLRGFFGCLADAVAYLHGQKMHHMDIKPENILIKSGRVYLGDFGASHDWSGKERSTTYSSSTYPTVYTSRAFSGPECPQKLCHGHVVIGCCISGDGHCTSRRDCT